MRIFLVVLIALTFLVACKKEQPDSSVVSPYTLKQPSYFPKITYNTASNAITKEGFELGKKLFNEVRLSQDNSVACSNCHVQAVGFSDPQHNPSIGIFERNGTRNAPTIANMAFANDFLWDGGIAHLDFVSVFAIENPNEMGLKLSDAVKKLNAISVYRSHFKSAFPEIDTITSAYMLRALSQYMLLLVSDNSKYDKVQRGETRFTDIELSGKQIFEQKCASCHSGALFTNQEFMNNGLDSIFKDVGRQLISARKDDIGKFKVPSLRNIDRTAPYMHDGRFSSLEEVLEHYSKGVKNSISLDSSLNTRGQLGIPLTEEEKSKILVYLKTLTDESFLSNPLFR